MSDEHPARLSNWLEYLGISDCICDWELRGLGVLYRQSLGSGWVRLTTNPACQHHTALNAAEERVREALAEAEEAHAAERAHHIRVTADLDQVLAKARDSVAALRAPLEDTP